jgi:hypothetical protein
MIVIDLVFGLGKNGVSIVKNHWNGHKNVKTCSPPKRASRGFHIYFECTSHPNEDRVGMAIKLIPAGTRPNHTCFDGENPS